MGERVQLGPLTYNVIETEWKTQLAEGVGSKIPANRYLIVKMSITNGGGGNVAVPLFTVEDAAGHSYPEVTEGTDAVASWLGLLRNMAPAQNENGVVIFDVPMGAYKLRISDGGDIGNEKTALIDIPVHLQ
jgi:Telomeric repeat-binding factor 2.